MKTILITGPTSGIGKAAATKLAALGNHLVLLARNKTKVELLQSELLNKFPQAKVDVVVVDLSSMKSVRQALQEVKSRYSVIHVLLNNAGGIFPEKVVTEDGFEYTFAANHLGHFLLTNGLLDLLKASGQGRVVNVSSEAHRIGKLDFSDLMFDKRSYSAMSAYANSKLCNIYFTLQLADRVAQDKITVHALHPGVVKTGFAIASGGFWGLVYKLFGFLMKDEDEGAATSVYLATAVEVDGLSGGYYKDMKKVSPSATAQDKVQAKKLWDVSEQLLHVF